MKILLDTPIWYWFIIGDKIIPNKIIDLINQSALSDSLYLSSISVWEIAMLENKGRISFKLPTSLGKNRIKNKQLLSGKKIAKNLY